jgi:hypothetical protein
MMVTVTAFETNAVRVCMGKQQLPFCRRAATLRTNVLEWLAHFPQAFQRALNDLVSPSISLTVSI